MDVSSSIVPHASGHRNGVSQTEEGALRWRPTELSLKRLALAVAQVERAPFDLESVHGRFRACGEFVDLFGRWIATLE